MRSLTILLTIFTLFLSAAHADFLHETKLGTELKLNVDFHFNNENQNAWGIYFQEGKQVAKNDLDQNLPYCRAHLFIIIADEGANIEDNSEFDTTIPKNSVVSLTWIKLGEQANPSGPYDLITELDGQYSLPKKEDNTEYQEFYLHCFNGAIQSNFLQESDLKRITGDAFDIKPVKTIKTDTPDVLDPLDLPYGCVDTRKGCAGVSKSNNPAFELVGVKNIKPLDYTGRDPFLHTESYGWSFQNNHVARHHSFYEENHCNVEQDFTNSFSYEFFDDLQPVKYPLTGQGEIFPPANLNFPEDYSSQFIHSPYFRLEKNLFEGDITMSTKASLTFNMPPSENNAADFYPLQIECQSTDYGMLTYRDVLAHISDYFKFEFSEIE